MDQHETARTEPLACRHHRHLDPPHDGDEIVSASIGPGGQAIVLWVADTDLPALTGVDRGPAGGFPHSRSPHPVTARVTVGTDHLVHLASLSHSHPLVQPLPDGRVLLAAARAHWRPDTGAEHNATVVDADGSVLTEQTLGDGIGDLLTSPSGQIWVGYFDEGIFGNNGWGGPGPPPLGCHGLARFDDTLTPTWQHPGRPTTGADTGPIDECYTLNLDDERAWCLMIDRPGFALDEITADHVHGRRAPAGPASALCTDGNRIALLSRRTNTLSAGPVADTDLPTVTRHRLVLPDGTPVPDRAEIVGRGPDLHLLVDRAWYRLDIDDVPTT